MGAEIDDYGNKDHAKKNKVDSCIFHIPEPSTPTSLFVHKTGCKNNRLKMDTQKRSKDI